MTIKLSTGLRTKMLNGGATGGIKGALDGGNINIYSGPQPLSADTGATGTLLATVSVASAGLTFDAAVAGAISKAAAEDWGFTGLANGTAGWFRFFPAAGDPSTTSTTEARIDGSIASSGGDMRVATVSIVTGAPNAVHIFKLTLPAQ